MKTDTIQAIALLLLFFGCYEPHKFDEALLGSELLTVQLIDESIDIPADGLTPVRIEVRLADKDVASKSVALKATSGTFSGGENSLNLELTRKDTETNEWVDTVMYTAPLVRGQVRITATVLELSEYLYLDIQDVGLQLTRTDPNQEVLANGASVIGIEVALDPVLQSFDHNKRVINLTTNDGLFAESGEKSLMLELKDESVVTVALTSGVSTSDIRITAKYFDQTEILSLTPIQAHPESIDLTADKVLSSGAPGTQLTLTAKVGRSNGTPTVGTAVTFVLPELDPGDVAFDAVLTQVNTSNNSGVATATLTFLSTVSDGDLILMATTEDEDGSELEATYTVRISN